MPTAQLDAGVRLRRLLAMLAHLAQVRHASIAELAERFEIDERTVVGELELAACCGLPPYTPDQLLELIVDDTEVTAVGLDPFRRPPRLTPSEGFAVAAAARALLAVTPDGDEGPLASALRKLEDALGEDRVDVELERPPLLGELRRAAALGEVIEIEYLGRNRGEATRRVVEPYAVVAREGAFYLDAWCHLAGDWRRFHVGRITEMRITGDHVTARAIPPGYDSGRAFVGDHGTRRAEVVVASGRQVLLERVAAGPPEPAGDGRVVVPVDVADERWFGLLLLRLGPDAEVRSPAELRSARATAAALVLDRYRGATRAD